MSKPRKRIKLECLECGSQFDDDYKSRHEKGKHNGVQVRVKHAGAPSNPFEAAKRKAAPTPPSETSAAPVVQQHRHVGQSPPCLDQQSTSAHHQPVDCDSNPVESNATDLSHEPPSDMKISITIDQSSIGPDSEPVESKTPGLPEETSCGMEVPDQQRSFNSAMPDDYIATQAATSDISKLPLDQSEAAGSSEKDFSWMNYGGRLAEFASNFEKVSKIVKKIINEETPNYKLVIIDLIDVLSKINEESAVLLDCAKTQDGKEEPVPLVGRGDVNVEHDPGKRKRNLSDGERRYLTSLGPFQPKLKTYPANVNVPSNKQCRFNSSWYAQHSLLEYSIEKDAAFCFACSLFPDGPGRGRECSNPEWATTGVRQWHKMKSRGKQDPGKLVEHFSSAAHRAAVSDYCHFLNGKGHVDALLEQSARVCKIREEQEREYHKKVLSVLFDIARTLGRQGLAFRGHGHEDTEGGEEDTESDKNGNFQQIVNLVSRHCPLLKKWIDDTENRPRHVSYLGAGSQNEFIDLLGTAARDAIVDEVKKAGIFAIMADTTPDLSHRDRLALNVRYVDESKGQPEPVERLIKMDVMETRKTGEELAEKIFKDVRAIGLPTDKVAFQSYDFASNMSGKYNGAQQKLSEKCEKNIPYIPCQPHRMNIFVETACSESAVIREFFNILEALYVFFYNSTGRCKTLQEKLKDIENALQLRNLSKTRFTARAESVKAVAVALEGIIDALEEIKASRTASSETRSSASALYKKLLDFDFICSLFFTKNVMFKVKNLTEQLESEKLNVIDCLQLIRSTVKSLERMRNDDEINALVESAAVFARKLRVNPEDDFKKHHRTRRRPKKYDDHPETTAEIDFLTFYRKEIKIVLDKFITAIGDNLANIISLMKPFHEIFQTPFDSKKCTLEEAQSLMQLCPDVIKGDPECVQVELQILLDAGEKCNDFSELSKVAFKLRNAIPIAYSVVHLVLTSPIASVSCERSFSGFKFIFNPLRTTMTASRLDNLMILYSAKDKVDEISIQSVVDKWSQLKHRRVRT